MWKEGRKGCEPVGSEWAAPAPSASWTASLPLVTDLDLPPDPALGCCSALGLGAGPASLQPPSGFDLQEDVPRDWAPVPGLSKILLWTQHPVSNASGSH